MTTRAARFGDIPRLVEIVRAVHAAGERAGLELDEKALKSLLMQAIQRHPRFSCAFVHEAGAGVRGFVIGVVDRLYGVSVRPVVQDLLLMVHPEAPAVGSASHLIDAYTAWGLAVPDVIEVQLGASMHGWQRVGKLYERKGYRQSGGMYARKPS